MGTALDRRAPDAAQHAALRRRAGVHRAVGPGSAEQRQETLHRVRETETSYFGVSWAVASEGLTVALEFDLAAGFGNAGVQLGQHAPRLDMAFAFVKQPVAETAFQRRFEFA